MHLVQEIPSSNFAVEVFPPRRSKLPDERDSITHSFMVGGHEGEIIVGLYPDGYPGEVFINLGKEGSTMKGLVDGFAILVSLMLQYNIPFKVISDKFIGGSFPPDGPTNHPDIMKATSILDYLFKFMKVRFPVLSYNEEKK